MRNPDDWARDREADRLDAQDAAARARLVPTHAPTDRVGDPPSLELYHCGDQRVHGPHPIGIGGGAAVLCNGTPLQNASTLGLPDGPYPPAVTVNVEAPQHADPDEVPNRWLHAIVSVLTGGAWLLGWAAIEVRVARRNRRRAAARLRAVRRGR